MSFRKIGSVIIMLLSAQLGYSQILDGNWKFDSEATKKNFMNVTDSIFVKERDMLLSELSINPPYIEFSDTTSGDFKMKLLVSENPGKYSIKGDTLYLSPQNSPNKIPCLFKVEENGDLLYFKLPEIPGMYFRKM